MGLRNLIRRSRASKPLRNNRGMALMLAISTTALIIYLALEVSYDTVVEYNVNAQELNRLKAYYAARGALEIGLLRVKIYQNVKTKFGEQVKNNPYVDQVWSFPIQWPLPLDMLGAVDKEEIEGDTAESFLDATYSLQITDEGSKIDINDLASQSENIQKKTEQRLLKLFTDEIEANEAFRRKYGSFRFDELINNIKDWITPVWTSANGGDKRVHYADFQNQEFPPNRAFRTVAELRMVPMMEDELYEFLLPKITVFGLKAVNPNTATLEVLTSLDAGITNDVANEIIGQRQTEPFQDEASFFSFVQSKAGNNLQARSAEDWPLTFGTMTSFRIEAIADFAGVTRKITAITMDVASTASIINEYLEKEKTEDPEKKPPGDPGEKKPPPKKKPAETLPKGPPRIVYWNEQ